MVALNYRCWCTVLCVVLNVLCVFYAEVTFRYSVAFPTLVISYYFYIFMVNENACFFCVRACVCADLA